MHERMLHMLFVAAEAWWDWLAGVSAQLCVVVAIVAATDWCLRRRSARLRYALWMLVLIRLVLPPSFAAPSGWGWWLRTSGEQTRVVASRSTHELPPTDRVVTSSPAPASESVTASQPLGAVLLMCVWCGVVVTGLTLLVASYRRAAQWRARAPRIECDELLNLLRTTQARLKVRGEIELRDSASCVTPLVIGWWRPAILLPSHVVERLTRDELATVLAHELHHVRRRDTVVNLLQTLLAIAYFFHPLVWLANARLRRLREDACDEAVVESLAGRRKVYGSALVKVAEALGYASPAAAIGAIDSATPMRLRLARILDPELPTNVSWSAVGIVLLAAAVALPGGARWTIAASPEDSPVETELQSSGDTSLQSPVEAMLQSPTETMLQSPVETESPSPPETKLPTADEAPATTERRETTALNTLQRGDFDDRWDAYAVLAEVGGRASVGPLEQAFLRRSGAEQDRALRTLQAVRVRLEDATATSELPFFSRQLSPSGD